MTEVGAANRLLGIVLCGGRSSRMGRVKAEMLHRSGESFLRTSIKRLESVCDRVAISGVGTIDGVALIRDPVFYQGPAVGIAASLAYADRNGFDACLFTPVDTPWLAIEDLNALKAAWQDRRMTTLAVSDRIEPLIGIYPIDEVRCIGQLATGRDRSLHRWIRSGNINHTTVKLDPAHCKNINTPEDWAEYAG